MSLMALIYPNCTKGCVIQQLYCDYVDILTGFWIQVNEIQRT